MSSKEWIEAQEDEQARANSLSMEARSPSSPEWHPKQNRHDTMVAFAELQEHVVGECALHDYMYSA